MKLFRNLLIIAAATAMLFASCKSPKGSGELMKSIPDSAMFVMCVEAKQLVDKGELNKFKEFALYGIIRKEMGSDTEKVANMLDEFLTNTRTSGLNLDQFYCYGIKGQTSDFNFVTMFQMDDMKTFEKKMKELMSASGGEGEEPKEKKGYKLLSLGYDGDMVWNKNMLYIVVGNYSWDEEAETDYSYLFAENDNNISKNADFTEFIAKKNDVAFWASYEILMNQFSEIFSYMYGGSDMKSLMLFPMDGTYLHMSGNFTNGEAKATACISPKSKVDEMLQKYPVLRKDFDANLLQYFPEQSFTTMKMSVNVQEYVRLMKDQFAKLAEVKKDEDYGYNPMAEINKVVENSKFKTISDGLVGDVVISLYDFQQGMIPMPMMGIAVNVKDKAVFDTIVALFPKDMVKKQDKFYTFVSGPLTVGYIACNNNIIYATSDKAALDMFLSGKGYDKNLGSSAMADHLKNDFFYWNVNVNINSYPEHITMLLRSNMGREYGVLVSFLSIYSDIYMCCNKDNEGEFAVKLQNKDANSLKVILKNLDENIPALMHMGF